MPRENFLCTRGFFLIQGQLRIGVFQLSPVPRKPLRRFFIGVYQYSRHVTLLILYETLVRPKLEYVSSTWDAYQSSLITSAEDMQNR